MARRAKTDYNADSIEWLKGLDGIRKRPGMYVGAVDSAAILHLFKEIVGNSIDEASNGHGDMIAMQIEGQTVTVFDRGRGIPTGPHKDDPKRDTLTIIMTELHSGGKLKDAAKNYTTAVGTNGLGLAVVNALSKEMQVFTASSGRWQVQSFAQGKPTSAVRNAKPAEVPTFNGKAWPKEGTIVQYTPDVSVFDKGSKLNVKAAVQWLKNLSWFVYGPARKRNGPITPVKFLFNINGKTGKIVRTGLDRYPRIVMTDAGTEPVVDDLEPFVFRSEKIDVVLYPTTGTDLLMYSAVNSVQTVADGTHVNELRRLLGEEFLKLSKRGKTFTLDDLLSGMVVCCNVRMVETQYNNQAKERLTSKITDEFAGFAEALHKWVVKNKSAMAMLVERATEINGVMSNVALNKKLASALKTKKGGKMQFPEGFVGSTTRNRDEIELSIVEGQSAGGSARKASDRRYQEVLPLRGKVLNVAKGGSERMDNSKAIIDLLKVIGYNPKEDLEKSRRVGRVHVLADPDPDGKHINSLLVGLLYSVMPQMFKEGRVYAVKAPLFAHKTVKETVYGATLKEVRDKVGDKFNSNSVTRFKGWGEMNPEDLKATAFSEDRTLLQISIEDAAAARKAYIDLLGKDPSGRRKMLGLSE